MIVRYTTTVFSWGLCLILFVIVAFDTQACPYQFLSDNVDVQSACRSAQEKMLRDMNHELEKMLVNMGISSQESAKLRLKGELGYPEWSSETDRFSLADKTPEYWSTIDFNISLTVKSQPLLICQGITKGNGSSKDSAWELALLNIVRNRICPVASDMILSMTNQASLQAVQQSLNQLDPSIWEIPKGWTVDAILGFIEHERLGGERFEFDMEPVLHRLYLKIWGKEDALKHWTKQAPATVRERAIYFGLAVHGQKYLDRYGNLPTADMIRILFANLYGKEHYMHILMEVQGK